MKKLILLAFMIFLWGCGNSANREEPIMTDSTSVTLELSDTTLYPEEYVESPAEESVAQLDSQRKLLRDTMRSDSISEESESERPFQISKLDTISLLPEIKRNKEIIKQQQEILDSLIKKK